MIKSSVTMEPRFQHDVAASPEGGAVETNGQANGHKNVGNTERSFSLLAGGSLAAYGLSRGNLVGLALAGLGAALVQRGVTGQCSLYTALKVDTNGTASEQNVEQVLETRGIHVEQAMLIDKPAADLYRFWRQLDNLPSFMHHLQSVQVLDDKRSRWVTKAPAIAGGSIQWDAEITRDEPDSLIAWRSLPGSEIDTAGQIRFSKAPGDRGTNVNVSMEYVPPAGKLGHWVATLFGDDPRQQMRDDLRSFKSLMEVGEVPSIKGQPRGTCTGGGTNADNEK